ncbi:MAG: hypothetical protein PF480_11755 [Roseovarius sp.]|jgi:hypothetical protein|nr:hypothetical protein [Roseovarius sp.]
MSTFENIADKSGTICVGALAFALGDPSGGTLAATGLAGLADIGIALRKTCATRACDAAAKATITALRDTPEFAEVNLLRVEALLQERQEHQSLNSHSLIAAYKKETAEERITALVTLLYSTIPFDGDTEQVKTLIRRALTAAMRVCYEDKEFRAQLSEETLISIARTTDGITITLERMDTNIVETKDDVKETKADVKETLNRIGNVESFLADLASQSIADLRVVAAAFGETTRDARPALIKFLTQKAEEYRRYRAQIDGLDERVSA